MIIYYFGAVAEVRVCTQKDYSTEPLSSSKYITGELLIQNPVEYNNVLINQRRKPFCKPPEPPNRSKQTPCPPPTTPYLLYQNLFSLTATTTATKTINTPNRPPRIFPVLRDPDPSHARVQLCLPGAEQGVRLHYISTL